MYYFNINLNFIYINLPKKDLYVSKVSESNKVVSMFFFSFLSFDTFSSQTLSEIISPFQQDAERDILHIPGKYSIHNAWILGKIWAFEYTITLWA